MIDVLQNARGGVNYNNNNATNTHNSVTGYIEHRQQQQEAMFVQQQQQQLDYYAANNGYYYNSNQWYPQPPPHPRYTQGLVSCFCESFINNFMIMYLKNKQDISHHQCIGSSSHMQ